MKTNILLLLSMIALNLKAQTIYPSGVSGCIARWTFDEPEGGNLATIQDWSGNNNHGNNNYITSDAGWNGTFNTAGKFNGSSSYSQIPASLLFNTATLTVLALIKFDHFFAGNCQGNNIVYNGFDYNSNLNWALYATDGNYDGNCNSFSPNFNKANFTTPNFVNNTIPLNNFIDSSKWYLIGCTYNGITINYYQLVMDANNHINNIAPSYVVNNTNQMGNGNYDVFIGATQNPPFPYWFNGKMDEVVIFNKALSNTEIKSVYDFLFGSPNTLESTTKNEKQFLYCTHKRLYFTSNTSQWKSIEVLDLSGNILKKFSSSGINQVDLTEFPNQIVFVKILDLDNVVTNHKFLLSE